MVCTTEYKGKEKTTTTKKRGDKFSLKQVSSAKLKMVWTASVLLLLQHRQKVPSEEFLEG